MTKRTQEILKTPEGKKLYEEELLIADATDTLEALLVSSGVSQKELAARLDLTEGRVSQILSGNGNLTLRTLGAVAWALGLRFELQASELADRSATPAAGDPPAPAWLEKRPAAIEPSFIANFKFPEPEPVKNPTRLVSARGQLLLAA